MPSPFPGMDPFLEGPRWPEAHVEMALAIKRDLLRQLPERYSVALESRVVALDDLESEIGIMYPDVEVSHTGARQPGQAGAAVVEVPIQAPLVASLRARIHSVVIRKTVDEHLITVIEIVSPANKAGEGLAAFREKLLNLHRSGVHVVEIDLLRRGRRALLLAGLASSPYRALVLRAGSESADVWPISLKDRLPLIPIPLTGADSDAVIDLQACLDRAYDDGGLARLVTYSPEPPPPPFAPEDLE